MSLTPTNIVKKETSDQKYEIIKSLDDLTNNKSKSIYYCMETYDAKLLSGIQHIKFFDKIKLSEPLPSSIESITFDCYFDKPIARGILPKNLKYLDLGWHFTQEITDDNLPESTETLIFGYWFNKNLFLKPRNLKKILVNYSYKYLVSPEILHLMPESYQTYYPDIQKNEVAPENYQQLDSLDLDDKEFDQDELNNEIALLEDAIRNRYDPDNCCTLDEKNIFLNKKNQIVIDLSISYWESHHVIFVGRNEKYYRTFWRHISIPKPYRLYTENEKIGPFNSISELVEHLEQYS